MKETNFEGIAVLVVIVIVALSLLGVYLIAKNKCLAAYENYKPQYSIFGGCRVEWNGILTPVDIIREMR